MVGDYLRGELLYYRELYVEAMKPTNKNEMVINLIDKFLNTHDIDIHDENRNTLLMYAVSFTDIDLVISFLENGTNPNIMNYDGKTSLTIAYENKVKELIEVLCGYGADFNLRNLKGKCLYDKVRMDGNNEILELFDNIETSRVGSDVRGTLRRKYLRKYEYIQ